jgi:hypothetical protein
MVQRGYYIISIWCHNSKHHDISSLLAYQKQLQLLPRIALLWSTGHSRSAHCSSRFQPAHVQIVEHQDNMPQSKSTSAHAALQQRRRIRKRRNALLILQGLILWIFPPEIAWLQRKSPYHYYLVSLCIVINSLPGQSWTELKVTPSWLRRLSKPQGVKRRWD